MATAEYYRLRRARLRAAGLCTSCGKESCDCGQKALARQMRWRKKHPDEYNAAMAAEQKKVRAEMRPAYLKDLLRKMGFDKIPDEVVVMQKARVLALRRAGLLKQNIQAIRLSLDYAKFKEDVKNKTLSLPDLETKELPPADGAPKNPSKSHPP